MKRLSIFFGLFLIGLTAWQLRPKNKITPAPTPLTKASEPPPQPKLGDIALANYGGTSSDGTEDLRLLTRYLDNVFVLVKNRDSRHYSTNEDLAGFLLGKNAYKEVFLSKDASILKNGKLIDRWGSPLIVHPISAKKLEIRSAGPDRKPYTEDDLIRN